MSRLIDADVLYDSLADKLLWLMNYGDETYLSVGNDIRNTIDAQPTAYDTDKVVEQLEGLREECEDILQDYCPEYFIDRAIEIVKGGGVND